jgi:hypothetical protein
MADFLASCLRSTWHDGVCRSVRGRTASGEPVTRWWAVAIAARWRVGGGRSVGGAPIADDGSGSVREWSSGPCVRATVPAGYGGGWRSAVHSALRFSKARLMAVRLCGACVVCACALASVDRDFLRVACGLWVCPRVGVWDGSTAHFAEWAYLVVWLWAVAVYVWLDWLASQLTSWLELAHFNTELQCWLSSLQNQNESSRAITEPS